MQSMNAINAPRNGSMLPGIWLLKWKTPQRIIGVRGGHTKRKQGRTNALPDMRIDYRKDHALMDLHSIFDPRSSILDPRSSILDPRSSILDPRGLLQWNIAMFSRRIGVAFVLQQLQRADQFLARESRLDHLVNEAALGGDVPRSGLVLILFDLFAPRGFLVRGAFDLAAIENSHGAFGAHHGHLGGRISEADVGADVFRSHHAIGSAIGFARDDCDLGHGRFGVCVEQLRSVAD